MAKKVLSGLILLVLANGIAFTQDYKPKNTVAVDVGPIVAGFLFAQVASVIDDNVKNARDDSSGFGIAVQYERQIFDKLSVTGRFSYSSAKTYVRFADMNLSSFSIEGTGRYYPFSGLFFLDGMLGYTRFSADLSGRDQQKGKDMDLANNYLKIGAKLGWKINFGKSDGFVFETALGYCYGIRMGSDDFNKTDEYSYSLVDTPMGVQKVSLGEPAEHNALNSMAKYLFVSGPRMTVCLEYRF